MPLVNNDTILSDIIAAEPAIIPVINRFGIYLGCSDYTVSAICRSMGLNVDFLVTVLNTFINDEYFPENSLRSFCASTLTAYLRQTNEAYLHVSLPNIRRHFKSLMTVSGDDNNLPIIYDFFNELSEDIVSRTERDKAWFAEIADMEAEIETKDLTLPEELGAALCDTSLADKLHDLKSMFIRHLSGQYDANLCYAVLVSVIALEKDVRQNDRIRNRILVPLSEKMREVLACDNHGREL
ncbi:MAG: hypothetical protein NC117_06910 [Pseudoflavonifractor sp.]|nr:hypothetical protein [Pseudoflavonifractor sp.]